MGVLVSSIGTRTNPIQKILSENSTDSSFPSRIPTTTKPTGDGVVKVLGSNVEIIFYGTDAADEAYEARVIGWTRVGTLWIPVPLIDTVTCTLGTAKGIEDATVDDDQFFVDTLASASGFNGRDTQSPEGNLVAAMRLDVSGAELLEITFNRSTAASANAMVRFY